MIVAVHDVVVVRIVGGDENDTEFAVNGSSRLRQR